MPISSAAERLADLLHTAWRHRMTGVALGQRLATHASPRIGQRG
jgi:hypothetical protein